MSRKVHIPAPSIWPEDPVGDLILPGVAWACLFIVGLYAVGVGSIF